MLFYGPPGTGKTSTILALAKQLFGPELIKTRVLELNASDERGISIVREKVKDFARMQLSNPPAGPAGEVYKQNHPCPPYKLIILDEADSMTQDAQSALRRTMETYSKITRFCLICNYVTRIIDPLASRCSKFRFKALDGSNASRRLEDISKLENVNLQKGTIEMLIRCADGDLRKAITFLQSAARLAASGSSSAAITDGKDADGDDEMGDEQNRNERGDAHTQITIQSVQEIAGVIPTDTLEELYTALQPETKGPVYEKVSKVITGLVADGWSATQLVAQLYERIVMDDQIAHRKKNRIVIVFSEVDKRLVDGADEHLVILDLCLQIANTLAEN